MWGDPLSGPQLLHLPTGLPQGTVRPVCVGHWASFLREHIRFLSSLTPCFILGLQANDAQAGQALASQHSQVKSTLMN
jgi:hypothetical protein